MRPETISAYHAEAHRQDLLREARQAALVAEARPHTGGMWRPVLLLASDLLLAAGNRLSPRLAERPMVHVHRVASCDITVVCCLDEGCAPPIACLET